MVAASSGEENLSFVEAYRCDTVIQELGGNSLSLFALSLLLRIEDVREFAASAVTEGPNDKKVDICHIDESDGLAVVAQSYVSKKWGKKAAPANKASDLNTAIAWLLSASEDEVPKRLRTKATELRRAIQDGSIKQIHIFFIHNCFESTNVDKELKTAADVARDIARSLAGADRDPPVVTYRELGLSGIEKAYRSRQSDILIDGWLDVPAEECLEETGEEWTAILTTVPGDWIRELHKRHGDQLFSANYRDFLGTVTRSGNINYQIAQTAQSEPANFWVYNNGITAITHELEAGPPPRIRGISIINGAQTTGALGEAIESATKGTKVLIRIVESQSKELVDKIILYNNTQNEIKPADRRSNDSTQVRLRQDFGEYGIEYRIRRSATRRSRNAITGAAIAPALCAFHGEPQTAFRNKKDIFNDDDTYLRVFPAGLEVEHVFLVQALSSAIDRVKTDLKRRVSDETATQLERQEYEALKYSASKHFLFYAIGMLAEEIMGRRLSDLGEWKCGAESISVDDPSLTESWVQVLHAILPQISTIVARMGEDPFYDVPRSAELSKNAAQELKALIASLQRSLEGQFEGVRSRTRT
jgi:hypothetical protein